MNLCGVFAYVHCLWRDPTRRLASLPAREIFALVSALAGRRTSGSEAVRQHAENDCGVGAAGRLANEDRKQASAGKPSNGEMSAAGRSEGGQNQHSGYAERPKQAELSPRSDQCRLPLTRLGRRARLSGQEEAQEGNSGSDRHPGVTLS
jgi:hypothetical protein